MKEPKAVLRRAVAVAVEELVEAGTPPVVVAVDSAAGEVRSELAMRAADGALGEVLSFPMRLLSELPSGEPCVLVCSHKAGLVYLTTSRAAYAAGRERGIPVFVGDEMRLMAQAAENDRANHAVFWQWCQRKHASGGWKLGPHDAFGEIYDLAPPKSWPVEAVLDAFELQLVAFCHGAEVPAP